MLKGLHLIYTYGEEIQKVFPKVPIIGFKNYKKGRTY